MLSTLVLLTVAAAPAAAAKPVTLALPGLNVVNLPAGEDQLYAEIIAQKFIGRGVKVMTSRDLSTVLGLERQKELLGCAEGSCVVEMTAALGVDGVIVGDLGKLGTQYALNLKVLSTRHGQPLALFNARADDERQLERVVENAVRSLLKDLAKAMNRPELAADTDALELRAPPKTPAGPSKLVALAPAAVGVLALGAGAVLHGVAGGTYTQLTAGPLPEPQARALRDSGRGLETGANIALIGGGVALVGAAVLFFAGADAAPAVAITPGGATVGVVGVLP